MTTVTMTYEKLYNNMANAFKVNNDPEHRPLGTYMLARAKAKKNEALAPSGSNLPATRDVKTSAISTVFSYVNDKLTVKEAPVRDRTMRSFPLRTSLTAFCSALVVCALVISCCFFGLSSTVAGDDNTVITTSEAETENTETTENETAFYSAK